jgi:hypothetical protein
MQIIKEILNHLPISDEINILAEVDAHIGTHVEQKFTRPYFNCITYIANWVSAFVLNFPGKPVISRNSVEHTSSVPHSGCNTGCGCKQC